MTDQPLRFGSPEANQIAQLDRLIESLPPCKCGGLPRPVYTDDGYVMLECSRHTNRTYCGRDNSATLLWPSIDAAIADWRLSHTIKERS